MSGTSSAQRIRDRKSSLEKKFLRAFSKFTLRILIGPHPPLFFYSPSNQGQLLLHEVEGLRVRPRVRESPSPRIYPIQQDTIPRRMITKTNTRNERPSKPVSASYTTIAVQMLPSDANPMGNVHGGTILKLVDMAAAAAALRHSRKNVVTVSIDRMDFIQPVYVGNLLTLKASVNYVGTTSMEVGVRVEAEDLRSGNVTHTNSSYLTYVALDDQGRPTIVPEVIPRTSDEKRRWKEGKQRRDQRLRMLTARQKARSRAKE